jgi:rod shape-determining protein MreC
MASLNERGGRPLLVRGPPASLRFIVLAGLSIALMVLDHRQQQLEQVRSFLSVMAYPLHWLAAAPGRSYAWFDESSKTRAELESDNVVLASENLRLKLRLQRFEWLEQENRRLRAASASTARIVDRTLLAEIMRVDLDPFRQRVLIGRGSRDGVFKGQAVLDAGGIFGQVSHVGPVSAELILISDSEHALPVQIMRNGLRTIAVGTGRPDELSLPYLSKNADIKVGDLLVSSGLGGVYPPGYPVARITDVSRVSNQPLLMVKAVPTGGLDRSPEVLLAWFENRMPEIPPEVAASTVAPQAGRPAPTADASNGPGTRTDAAAPSRAVPATGTPADAAPAPGTNGVAPE